MEKTINEAAREFAATKVTNKNRQPDNDIFFAAKEGFEVGANFIIEKYKEFEEWKSVEKELPEYDKRVIVKTKKGDISIVELILNEDEELWKINIYTAYSFDEVTHWRNVKI